MPAKKNDVNSVFRKSTLALIVVGALLLGIAFGWYLSRPQIGFFASSDDCYLQNRRDYPLIKPLVECDNGKVFTELRPFEYQINSVVDKLIKASKATHISVYYMDLNSGRWFGINEHTSFSPASLLKIPVMMTYFKLAEEDPHILTEKITFEGNGFEEVRPVIQPAEVLQLGYSYSVDDLITRMIVYSDNESLYLLADFVPEEIQDDVYRDFGLVVPNLRDIEDFMTIKEYASFFRSLYNSSYLSQKMSNRALTLLLESDFEDGLEAGVPQYIPVAQKFGERGYGYSRQFHDCGIVYYPNHPYLLCVMTRGYNYNTLKENIGDISKEVYREVDTQVTKLKSR